MTVLDYGVSCYSEDLMNGHAIVTDMDNGYNVEVLVKDGIVVGLKWMTVMPPGREGYDYFLTHEDQVKLVAQTLWTNGPHVWSEGRGMSNHLAEMIRARFTPVAFLCDCEGSHEDCASARKTPSVYTQMETVRRIATFIEDYYRDGAE